jgi:hypothetical protein
MTKPVEFELQIGANFSAAVALDSTQTGRTHRAHIREMVASPTVKLAFSTANNTITLSANTITLTAGADVTEVLSLATDSAFWVIDIESVGATAADVRREASGSVLVTRDVTRLSEPTASANASKLLTYSLTDGQTLTSEEQEHVREKIGAGSGSTGSIGSNWRAGVGMFTDTGMTTPCLAEGDVCLRWVADDGKVLEAVNTPVCEFIDGVLTPCLEPINQASFITADTYDTTNWEGHIVAGQSESFFGAHLATQTQKSGFIGYNHFASVRNPASFGDAQNTNSVPYANATMMGISVTPASQRVYIEGGLAKNETSGGVNFFAPGSATEKIQVGRFLSGGFASSMYLRAVTLSSATLTDAQRATVLAQHAALTNASKPTLLAVHDSMCALTYASGYRIRGVVNFELAKRFKVICSGQSGNAFSASSEAADSILQRLALQNAPPVPCFIFVTNDLRSQDGTGTAGAAYGAAVIAWVAARIADNSITKAVWVRPPNQSTDANFAAECLAANTAIAAAGTITIIDLSTSVTTANGRLGSDQMHLSALGGNFVAGQIEEADIAAAIALNPGPTGPQGATGATGAQGPQGDAGATGATGSQGIQGATGATGAQGPQGDAGATGATGSQGIQGATGATGAQGPQGPSTPITLTTITTSGSYAPQSGAKLYRVEIIGSTGGAGSGRKGAAATIRCGGGGTGGGGYLEVYLSPAELGTGLTVTIGAAGVGGAAQGTNSTNGNNGTSGGATTVVASTGWQASVPGGALGQGGTASTGTAGGAVNNWLSITGLNSGAGAAASTTGLVGVNGSSSVFTGSGGGAGGGITSANVASAGGAGGAVGSSTTGLALRAGGSSGAIATNGGAGNAAQASGFIGASGGGGGGSSLVGNAGNGANAVLFGGGAGGGGAAVDAVGNSGAGGNGVAGAVLVTAFF